MKTILDWLYLPIFIIKYRKHYKGIGICVEDYFTYYTYVKRSEK